uniref:Alanine--glyoxylate aminotransferase 2, mitochondrial n=1 Tax=Lepisosteus oculatus TaxID=7918 RepID=W5N1L2_LEPOC
MFKAFPGIKSSSWNVKRHPVRLAESLVTFHRLCGAVCQQSIKNYPLQNLPKMPPCDFKPEEYKDLSMERMMEIRKRNCSPMTMKVTYYKSPVFLHQGYMQWLWGVNGQRYLDFFGGIATVSVGHCHPKVKAAAQRQMERLWHTTQIYVLSPIHEYCEKLAACFPDPLKVIYLTNSGSEANDLAMLMARLHTGNFDIITLRGSYHGGSPQSLGLTSNSDYKYPIAAGFGCHTTMCPDVFRGPWGGRHCRDSAVQAARDCSCAPGCCQANDMYIEQLKEVLKTSVPNQIAGFFAEPIQGIIKKLEHLQNSVLTTSKQFFCELFNICVQVQTGFGRTGSDMWGFAAHDVIPDIVTLAKGIANGFPMGAVVTTPEVAHSFAKGLHFNTFGGNPVGCAIASAVLDTIEEDGTQQNCANVGTYLLTELAKLRDKFEIIGDVRGKGLQIGVEMVKNKGSREPLPAAEMNQIFEDCKDMGLLIGKGGVYGQTFRIKPPMCITKEDADFALSVFSHAIQSHMEKK